MEDALGLVVMELGPSGMSSWRVSGSPHWDIMVAKTDFIKSCQFLSSPGISACCISHKLHNKNNQVFLCWCHNHVTMTIISGVQEKVSTAGQQQTCAHAEPMRQTPRRGLWNCWERENCFLRRLLRGQDWVWSCWQPSRHPKVGMWRQKPTQRRELERSPDAIIWA